MTNPNLTEIVFLLDETGSMTNRRDMTISAFNEMLTSQKGAGDRAKVTLVMFSLRGPTTPNVRHQFTEDIEEVPELTEEDYVPGGSTPLLDATGTVISNVGQRLAELPEEERPGRVLFVVITDGLENSSTEYTQEQIEEMVEHQKEKYSWEFLFLGCEIDAWQSAALGGLRGTQIAQTDHDNYQYTIAKNLSQAVTEYRTSGSVTGWGNGNGGTTD